MPTTITPVAGDFDVAITPSIDGSYLLILAGAGPFTLSDREASAAKAAGWLGTFFNVSAPLGAFLPVTLPATI